MLPRKIIPDEQRRKFLSIENHWEDDAERDKRYNKHMEQFEMRAGNHVEAKLYEQEAAWDDFWGKRRKGIIKHLKDQINK